MLALYITEAGRLVCERLKSLYKGKLDIKKIEKGKLKDSFEDAFSYKAIIAVMATGIVVRGIAPLLKSKTSDPAIVVIDEKAQFVISLLSGHIGGANALAHSLAKKLRALPIITTSSDVQEYLAVDLYAKEKKYFISNLEKYRDIAMAMTKDKREKIGAYVMSGEEKSYFQSAFFKLFSRKKDFLAYNGLKVAVTIEDFNTKDVLYLIPRKLVLGMGFHKGMSSSEIFDFIKEVCKEEQLHWQAIKKVATIDKRRKDPGFLEFCRLLNAETVFYSSSILNEVKEFTHSRIVYKYHGTGNVAEVCAYLASNRGKIVVPKKKGGTITVCMALERSL